MLSLVKREPMEMSKKNYNMVDLWKLIMSVIVVAIHVEPLHHIHNPYLQVLSHAIFALPVPFFFIVSGFLLAERMKIGNGNVGYNSSIIKGSLFSYVKMYLIWSAVYLPIDIIHSIKEKMSLLDWLKRFFQGIFFIGEHYNSWVLWYLLSAIYALLILLLFIKHIGNKGLLFLFIIFVIISMFCDYASVHQLPGYFKYFNIILSNTFVNGRIFRGLFYIPLGMLISNVKIKKGVQICLFVFGFLINLCFDNALQTFGVIICSVGLFLLVLEINLRNSMCFLAFRKMSTCIYFIHLYVWTIMYTILYGEKKFGMKIFLITVVVSIAISLVYALLNIKIINRCSERKHRI